MKKRCTKCDTLKRASEFASEPRNRSGLSSHCKECIKARNRAYRERTREKWNQYTREKMFLHNLKKLYGITEEEYRELYAVQGGRCRICTKRFKKTPHVDHDHVTGKVRGLLCIRCNTGLGCFDDDVERLRAAIRYLRSQ